MDAHGIAEALDLKRNGKGYRGACPVCGGSDKSTKFSISDNGGKVLVKCFAGCPQDEVIHDLKVRGLWPDTAPIQKRAHIKQMIERDGERAKLALFVYQENIARGYQMNEVETCKYLELKWRAGL